MLPLAQIKLICRQRAGLRGLAIAVVVIALASACSGNSTTGLAAPSPTALREITITQTSSTSTTCQLAATAHLGDGTTRDVTSTALWDSSNPAIATVSNTGLVTVAAAGGVVELRATYQGVSGSFRLVMMAGPVVVLSGVVREVQPNQHPLAGARVEITDGPDAGKFAMTDASGSYLLTMVSMGTVSLAVTLEGYQPWRLNNVPLPGDTLEDPWLVPVPPRNADGVTATARCRDGAWSWALDQAVACQANGGIAYLVCPGPLCRPD